MESQPGVFPALCIVGMGRSGTSLVSSMLQSGGLHIGQRLMGPGDGNSKGHFEDLDFYEFHMWVLEAQGIHNSGFTLQGKIQIREQHLFRARELVEERRRHLTPWGWKDPRTTLFLDFWQELIPEANFLILYRPPWDVVDSLFRRGDEVFRSNPVFAVRVWEHYNRLALDFQDRHPTRCLCASSYRVAQSPTLLLDALARKFGLKLEPVADLYEDSLLRRSDSPRWASLIQHHFPEVMELYDRLNERAAQDSSDGNSLAAEPTRFLSSEDWALQDWLDFRVQEGQRRRMQAQLEQKTRELNETREELERSQANFSQALTDLSQSRTDLSQALADLAQTRAELSQTQVDLRQSRGRFDAAQELLTRMENTKFWKLRKAWFRVKRGFRQAG
jgi:O-antigen biosynthesis protein